MSASLVWLGFLPVVAFLCFDSPVAPRRGLWAALALGAMEAGAALAYASGAPDIASLGAFAVLAGLVALSLRTGDSFYFKIHGPIINALTALVLLGAWYIFNRALLLDVALKEVGLERLAAANPSVGKDAVAEMLRLLSLHLPWWLLLHALLTVYAAANWGKWAWAFVRIPGFFVMLFLASNFAGAAALGPAASP